MKGIKSAILFFILILVCSCGSNDSSIQPERAQLIAKVEGEGFRYIGPAPVQNGIWDTVLLGYTDRGNGVYHNRSERFEHLRIDGYEFEELGDELYKRRLMIFCFAFDDSEEKRRFEELQPYLLNYQRHSKNQVEFHQNNGEWLLRFEPMP